MPWQARYDRGRNRLLAVTGNIPFYSNLLRPECVAMKKMVRGYCCYVKMLREYRIVAMGNSVRISLLWRNGVMVSLLCKNGARISYRCYGKQCEGIVAMEKRCLWYRCYGKKVRG